MNKNRSPLHQFWHRKVEGQIRHTMNLHPKWFIFQNQADKNTCINSLAKRIVGEIIAVRAHGMIPEEGGVGCVPLDNSNGGMTLPLEGGDMGTGTVSPSIHPTAEI